MNDKRMPSLLHLTGVPRRLASAILGSGVVVALFVAPFLGSRRIRGFEPLLSLFREDQQALPLAIATFFIGLVALAIQFFATESIARRSILRRFKLLLPAVAAGPLVLAILYLWHVAWVDVPIGEGVFRKQSFVVGWSRLTSCECLDTESNAKCIEGLSYDEADFGSCWSEGSILQVKLALLLLYLVAIEGFGILAGLLVLKPPRKKRTPRKRKRRKPAAPVTPGKTPPAPAAS